MIQRRLLTGVLEPLQCQSDIVFTLFLLGIVVIFLLSSLDPIIVLQILSEIH